LNELDGPIILPNLIQVGLRTATLDPPVRAVDLGPPA
jgi:hypothetical protein